VGSALAPITGPMGGLAGPVVPGGLLPLPGLVGSGTGSRAGPAAGTPAVPFTGFEGTGSAAGVASASPTYPVRAMATLSRPRAGRLLEVGPLASLAGVGLLGSSPFTLVGDPATGSLLPVGDLTLDGLAGETRAGIGVLESGPIASGNQVDVDAGDISPSVTVTVCGNSVGVLSTGGIIAPTPPGTTPGRTDTVGTPGIGSTGTSGIPGTLGLTPGGAGATTAFAPLRGAVSGSGALPFTGAGNDLLALFAAGPLAAGALFLRATRPAAATEGGGNR
jgi:hypothetical protein